MKKIIPLILVLLLIISGCSVQEKVNVENIQALNNEEYIKAIWITYYELSEFTVDKSEDDFKSNISSVFKTLKEDGFNTVIVQVRPYADAFYKSEIFPVSEYFNSKQGGELVFDALEIMCDLAHKCDLRIEAWINPYRVSRDNDITKLSDDNIAKKWYNKDSDNVVVLENGIYFNPAAKDVTKLIVSGVEEIIEGYNVDGIHFDDYFYPTDDEKFDESSYSKYIDNKGEMSLDDWRRENVSNMIKEVYSAIKKYNSSIRFGVSPASNITKNYNELYADVERWVTEKGCIDYICPQIYFGFRNVYQPFMRTVKMWKKLCEGSEVDLYIGVPLYKSSKVDEYAGADDDARNEFVDNSDIISRQIKYIEKIETIKGYFVFSYSCLNNEECENEVSLMLEAMQSSSPLVHQPRL